MPQHKEAAAILPITTDHVAAEKAGGIIFENVSFHYPSRRQYKAIDNISLTIESMEYVAIVGASGAGKSTIFQLLLRFYEIDTGRILIDNVDIKSLSLNDLRNIFAIVPQDSQLFANDIMSNIRYGAAAASDEQVIAAAKLASAHDFIIHLPHGYNTILGDGGSLLSTGQKQRIAIARAIIRQPKILLLDEATSALDSQSEKSVQSALAKLSKKCTTIVIAHRLATVIKAGRIIVLDQGRIVEIGNHNQLIAAGGVYARLVLTQMQPS